MIITMFKKIVTEIFMQKTCIYTQQGSRNIDFLSVWFQGKQIISLKKSMKLMEKKIYLYDEFFRSEI
jgi:hypothetical protein